MVGIARKTKFAAERCRRRATSAATMLAPERDTHENHARLCAMPIHRYIRRGKRVVRHRAVRDRLIDPGSGSRRRRSARTHHPRMNKSSLSICRQSDGRHRRQKTPPARDGRTPVVGIGEPPECDPHNFGEIEPPDRENRNRAESARQNSAESAVNKTRSVAPATNGR